MVTKGWPPLYTGHGCHCSPFGTEANKLSRHASLTVCSPHTFQDLLSHPAFLSFPTRAQVQYAFSPLTLSSHSSPCFPINPTSLLPKHPLQQTPLHSCSLTDLTQNSPFQHLTGQPILDPDTPHWFVDGSSQKSSPFMARHVIIQENFS